ncbi:MAG TPA: protease pro-enzyme activation domain-containing protein, partial [Bryobacteraceae bacterium]|nr:protease pro-enzyme activation domain-containing protein [Bryobacteraceae bacterium]
MLKPVPPGLVALLCLFAAAATAQQSRVRGGINDQERVRLSGHVHPRAIAANDQGRAAPSLKLSYVTLEFNQSASQKAELAQLLADQQNSNSPNYHHWLTPEQYADRFGVSPSDLNAITAWLQAQGLTVVNTARGRDWIAVSGSAAQIENAFQTEIHQYVVNGESHFANATEPSVPAAIAPMVMSIGGLHNFRMKPLKAKPRYNSSSLCGGNCLAPDDLATIYDIKSLYGKGIDGTGQTIVVAGQTGIVLSDITQFRSNYGLPPINLTTTLVPGSPDPGILNSSSDDELAEADLDLEWSGAVARNAAIHYVYADPNRANGVMQAVQYAIDNDLAPVVSTSYGNCEQETARSDLASFQSWAQKGNSFGITWFNASGDSGAADCDDKLNHGLAVDAPASVPEVVGVGGTAFNEQAGAGPFWSSTNNPVTGASALSWIPETSWNDSVIDGSPSASGGGVSTYFAKPTWQSGPGVPADNMRDVPDVSLAASADHDGYLVYTEGSTQVYGGTSVSAQVFAGIGALMNQYQVMSGKPAGMGNLNKALYPLAVSTPGIFHDITTGNNIVTVPGCSGGRVQPCGAVGYNAGPGYDQVVGLGSVDVCYLTTGSTASSVGLTLLSNLTSMSSADTTYLIAIANTCNGVTPTGAVEFMVGGTNLGQANLVGSNGSATAILAVTGAKIGLTSSGSQTVTAQYLGSSSTVTASVTVSGRATRASTGTPAITGITNAGSYKQVYAPGEIVAVFGSNLALATASSSGQPFPPSMAGVSAMINGEAVPLWYISPVQFNIQIPYEVPVGGQVTLEINNNGALVTSQVLTIAAAAPGIFTDQNGNIANGLPTATPGSVTTLYITGIGAVTPSVPTGAAPAAGTPVSALPAPTQTVTVTVNGLPTPTTIQFDGITPDLVGVAQI